MYKLNIISLYFEYLTAHLLHLQLTSIIKLADAVDSTTLPTTKENSVVNVQSCD